MKLSADNSLIACVPRAPHQVVRETFLSASPTTSGKTDLPRDTSAAELGSGGARVIELLLIRVVATNRTTIQVSTANSHANVRLSPAF